MNLIRFATESHPLALAGFLPVWDVERRTIPLAPVIDWTLEELRRTGRLVDTLENLYQYVTPAEAPEIARCLSAASISPTFQWQLHRALADAMPDLPWDQIWIQARAHYRILLPGDTVSPVPLHTDFGFGHRLNERNLWISLTNAENNAALHLYTLSQSLHFMKQIGQTQGVFDSLPMPPPMSTRAGELLLFTPLHIHGARMPDEHQCRVSIDIRIMPRSETLDFTFCPLRLEP